MFDTTPFSWIALIFFCLISFFPLAIQFMYYNLLPFPLVYWIRTLVFTTTHILVSIVLINCKKGPEMTLGQITSCSIFFFCIESDGVYVVSLLTLRWFLNGCCWERWGNRFLSNICKVIVTKGYQITKQ